ncbi:juvenile hormone acid O-methyltransferase isoform X2 [Rhipicephalus microplus]|uniref:juvenile hormone acid O-methyltransferase isoform X2 n=1 Tax=Rhipicephalus microplus TaxID=6941 RepID=UPI003F6D77DE
MKSSFDQPTARPANMSVDLKTYVGVESYPSQEDLNAWQRISFCKASKRHHQHLDVGCGLGKFTRNHLLPFSRPCRRLVAVDHCARIVEYARESTWHSEIFYDVLDIEKDDDVTLFIGKNVRRLLAENGECVVVSCVSTQLTDVWLQVHETQKWKAYVPDPKEIFSSYFRFNCVAPFHQIEDETATFLTQAGLHCVRCEVYENEWTFPDIDTIIHFFFAIFGSEEVVPDSEKEAFKNVWRTILEKKTQESLEGGRQLKFLISVAHASHAA